MKIDNCLSIEGTLRYNIKFVERTFRTLRTLQERGKRKRWAAGSSVRMCVQQLTTEDSLFSRTRNRCWGWSKDMRWPEFSPGLFEWSLRQIICCNFYATALRGGGLLTKDVQNQNKTQTQEKALTEPLPAWPVPSAAICGSFNTQSSIDYRAK